MGWKIRKFALGKQLKKRRKIVLKERQKQKAIAPYVKRLLSEAEAKAKGLTVEKVETEGITIEEAPVEVKSKELSEDSVGGPRT